MKRIISKINYFFHRQSVKVAVAALPLLSLLQTGYAQDKNADIFLQNITNSANSLGGKVVTIVQIVIGVVGLVWLIPVVIKAIKGDQQSQDSLLKWFGILVVAIAGIQVLRMFFFAGA